MVVMLHTQRAKLFADELLALTRSYYKPAEQPAEVIEIADALLAMAASLFCAVSPNGENLFVGAAQAYFVKAGLGLDYYKVSEDAGRKLVEAALREPPEETRG
jgi:hypothetical protein